MSENLVLENFTGLIGKICSLKDEKNSHNIEIMEVNKLKKRSPEGHDVPFVVEIRCEEDEILEQKIYKISGEGLEEKDIFFSPVGRDAKGHLYEAIFN